MGDQQRAERNYDAKKDSDSNPVVTDKDIYTIDYLLQAQKRKLKED